MPRPSVIARQVGTRRNKILLALFAWAIKVIIGHSNANRCQPSAVGLFHRAGPRLDSEPPRNRRRHTVELGGVSQRRRGDRFRVDDHVPVGIDRAEAAAGEPGDGVRLAEGVCFCCC